MPENGQEMDRERDAKGQFVDGWTGGPGRGNVKDNLEDLDVWQATEQIIRKQMSSGKGSDQLKASQVYLKWQELKKQHDHEQENKLPEPDEIENIRELLSTKHLIDVLPIKRKTDFYDTVKHIQNHCTDCQRLQE